MEERVEAKLNNPSFIQRTREEKKPRLKRRGMEEKKKKDSGRKKRKWKKKKTEWNDDEIWERRNLNEK